MLGNRYSKAMDKGTEESADSTIENASGGTGGMSFNENSQLLGSGNKSGSADNEQRTSEILPENHDWQSFNAAVTGHKVGPVDLDKSDSQTSQKQ